MKVNDKVTWGQHKGRVVATSGTDRTCMLEFFIDNVRHCSNWVSWDAVARIHQTAA